MTTKNKMNEEAAMPPDNLLISISGFEFWLLTIKNAVFDWKWRGVKSSKDQQDSLLGG